MWGDVGSVGNLPRGDSVWNSRATGKRVIAEGCLPVSGDHELGTIEKLGSIHESPGKIGAIEYSFEEVRAFEMGS